MAPRCTAHVMGEIPTGEQDLIIYNILLSSKESVIPPTTPQVAHLLYRIGSREMSEDRKITCPKCGMQMMESQERTQVRCVTKGCPLENAAKAGQDYASASKKDQEQMRGIIIGTA